MEPTHPDYSRQSKLTRLASPEFPQWPTVEEVSSLLLELYVNEIKSLFAAEARRAPHILEAIRQ